MKPTLQMYNQYFEGASKSLLLLYSSTNDIVGQNLFQTKCLITWSLVVVNLHMLYAPAPPGALCSLDRALCSLDLR